MSVFEPWEREILARGWRDDVDIPPIITKPKGDDRMTAREKLEAFLREEKAEYVTFTRREALELRVEAPQIIRDPEAYQAFVAFLRGLTGVLSVFDVAAAAGALLQDLGEEPS